MVHVGFGMFLSRDAWGNTGKSRAELETIRSNSKLVIMMRCTRSFEKSSIMIYSSVFDLKTSAVARAVKLRSLRSVNKQGPE